MGKSTFARYNFGPPRRLKVPHQLSIMKGKGSILAPEAHFFYEFAASVEMKALARESANFEGSRQRTSSVNVHER